VVYTQKFFDLKEGTVTRKRQNPDLVLRLQGLNVPDGTLGGEDLIQLAKIIKALGEASPDLAGGYLVSLTNGSSRPGVAFPTRGNDELPGMHPRETSLLGIFQNGGYTKEDGWKVPKGVREGLCHWSQKKVTVSVSIAKTEGKAYYYRFTPQKVKQFSENIAEKPIRKLIQGKLRALDGADSEFELHFDHQKLICPFPSGSRPTGLYFEKYVEVVVFVKSRPTQGPWRAIRTESIRLLPEAPHLEFGSAVEGMVPPSVRLPGGFQLAHFFNGPTPEDIEALCQALSRDDE